MTYKVEEVIYGHVHEQVVLDVATFKDLAVASDLHDYDEIALTPCAVERIGLYVIALENKLLELKREAELVQDAFFTTAEPVKAEEVPPFAVALYRGRQRKLQVGDRVVFGISVNRNDGTLPDWATIWKVHDINDHGVFVTEIKKDGQLGEIFDTPENPNDLVLLKLSDFARFPQAVQPGDVIQYVPRKGSPRWVVDSFTTWGDEYAWDCRRPNETHTSAIITLSDLKDRYRVVDTPQ